MNNHRFISTKKLYLALFSFISAIGIGGYILLKKNANKRRKLLRQRFTKENLVEFLNELKVEIILPLRKYQDIAESICKRYLSNERELYLYKIQKELEEKIHDCEHILCAKYKLPNDLYTQLLDEHKNETDIIQVENEIQTAIQNAGNGTYFDLKLGIPENLTKAMFLKIQKQKQCCLWHLHYKEIRSLFTRKRGKKFTKQDIQNIRSKFSLTKITEKVFIKLIGVKVGLEEDLVSDYENILKKAISYFSQDGEFTQLLNKINEEHQTVMNAIITKRMPIEILETDPFPMDIQEFNEYREQILDYVRIPKDQIITELLASNEGKMVPDTIYLEKQQLVYIKYINMNK